MKTNVLKRHFFLGRFLKFAPVIILGFSVGGAYGEDLQETFVSPTPAVANGPGDTDPDAGAFLFPQFDPSLGSLHYITLTMDGSYSFNGIVDSEGGPQDFQGPLTSTFTMGVSDDEVNASLNFNNSFVVPRYDSNPVFRLSGSGSNQTFITTPVALEEFIGIGSISLPGYFDLTDGIPRFESGNIGMEDGTANLLGSITYTYTVPDFAPALSAFPLLFVVMSSRFKRGRRNLANPVCVNDPLGR